MENSNELLTPELAGKELGNTPPSTLQWWRTMGRGPRYVKIGRRVLYRRSDLETFVASGEVAPEQAA